MDTNSIIAAIERRNREAPRSSCAPVRRQQCDTCNESCPCQEVCEAQAKPSNPETHCRGTEEALGNGQSGEGGREADSNKESGEGSSRRKGCCQADSKAEAQC